MVLFSAKRNMLKRTISILLISLFVVSSFFSLPLFIENTAKAQSCEAPYIDDPDGGPCILQDDVTNRTTESRTLDTRTSLNSANESLSATLGNSGCTALGGVVGSTLSSLGQQLLSSAGISGLGSSAGSAVSNALGGGVIGGAVGSAVGSAVNSAANSVTNTVNQGINQAVSGATGAVNQATGGIAGAIQSGISEVTNSVIGGANNILSSDLLSGATNAVGTAFYDLGTSLGSNTLMDLGFNLSDIAGGGGSITSLFGGASGAIPGVGAILSLIGGSGPVPTDPITIVKQINTLQQDTSILKTKETCLNRLAYTSSLITRAKMEDNVRKWLNTGNNGNPLYVTNMNDYLLKQTQNQTRLFISDLSKSNSPYKNDAIRNIVSGEQAKNNSNTAGALNDSLPSVIGSTNAVKYRNGDFSAGGWKAWNALTQIEANNKFGHIIATERLYQEGQDRAEAEAKEKLVNDVSPIEECVEVDAASGACRRYKVVTPASVIEEKLRLAATAPERNAGTVGADSNETISSADLILGNYLTDPFSSFWKITDNNSTARDISNQELSSASAVIDSINKTTNSIVAYVALLAELHGVISEASTATNSLVALGPVTYCPSNLANQSSSGVASLFDRVALYSQAITSLEQEMNATARTVVELYALKDTVSFGSVDYRSAASELVAISTSNRVPSSDVVTSATTQLSQAKTIRDTTKGLITACEAEHLEILAEEERKKLNSTPTP